MHKLFRHTLLVLLVGAIAYCEGPGRFEIRDARTYQLLEHFFRKGVDQEQYTYVIGGAKPLSCRMYCPLSLFPSSSHQTSEQRFEESVLFEAIRSRLEMLNRYSSRIIFKCADMQREGHKIYESRCINRRKLHETLEENINLFRLILSPAYEVDALFNAVVQSNHSLYNILGNHDALLGIILGYLPHNSLLGGRDYALSTQAISQEHPPYEPQSRLLKPNEMLAQGWIPDIYGLYYLAHAGGGCERFRTQYKRMRPSCQFASVIEERRHLQTKQEELPTQLLETPAFIFGPYQTKESSNRPFFKLLKKVQNQTRELGQREHLVEAVLEKILDHPPTITCGRPSTLQPLESLIRIGKQKWVSILTEAMSHFKRPQDNLAFLEGFGAPCEHYQTPPKVMTASPKMRQGFELASSNLERSDAYFKTIPEDFVPIIPKQLYYQVVRKGQGNRIEGCNEIRIHYTLKDLDGNMLSAHYNAWFNLAEVFQGFRHGVQGMAEGEKRTVLIHPTLGYGPFTTLPPCATLVLSVELLEVADGGGSLPPLEPIDCSLIRNTTLYKDIELSIDHLPYYRGAFYAKMFERFGSTSKEAVLSALRDCLQPAH